VDLAFLLRSVAAAGAARSGSPDRQRGHRGLSTYPQSVRSRLLLDLEPFGAVVLLGRPNFGCGESRRNRLAASNRSADGSRAREHAIHEGHIALDSSVGCAMSSDRMRGAPRTNRSHAIADRRQAERYPIALAVTLPTANGITHNVSESGVLFESDVAVAVDEPIDLILIFREALPGDPIRIRCSGNVVRVEPRGRRQLVAVHLNNYHIAD
jgi:hypothetical protein